VAALRSSSKAVSGFSVQGLTAMMYRSRTLMNGLGYAWKALERCFPTNVTEKISWMTFCADKMVSTLSSLAAAISVHRLACKTLRFENQGGRAVSGFPRILESP